MKYVFLPNTNKCIHIHRDEGTQKAHLQIHNGVNGLRYDNHTHIHANSHSTRCLCGAGNITYIHANKQTRTDTHTHMHTSMRIHDKLTCTRTNKHMHTNTGAHNLQDENVILSRSEYNKTALNTSAFVSFS